MMNRTEIITKINDMIGDIKVAMLTTVDEDGDFHSRPMMTQKREFDGVLWFFASRSSDKVREVKVNPSVNVAYVDDGNYVSLAGSAEIVTDVLQKEALWNDALKVWFEDGPQSADVVLIRVDAKSAQYWDTPGSGLGQAVSMIKVMLTGDKDAAGDSEKVTF